MSDDAYAAKALGSELDRVLAAVEGTRNHTLHLAAFRIGQLVAEGRLAAVEAERELVAAGLSTGLGMREASATVRSGLRGGLGKPRDPSATPTNGAAVLAGLARPNAGVGPLSYAERWRLVDERLGLMPMPAVDETGRVEAAPADTVPATDGTVPVSDEEPPWPVRIRSAVIESDQLDDIPAPEPLIPGVLFRNTIAWLFGPPGSCKSFIALDVAGCVGTGENWQGVGKAAQGAVLYVVAEGVSGIRARVRAWEASMGVRMANVRFLPMPVQVTDRTAWAALVEYAAEIGAALIVLDTQARISVGLEENSAKEMGALIEQVERLRRATGACVMPIHHTGRGGEHLRGSIALDGAADTLIKVSRCEEIIEVECAKQKDAPEFSQLRLRVTPFETSIVLSTTLLTGTSTLDSAGVKRMLAAWWDSFGTEWVSPKILCETTETPRMTYFRHANKLVTAGMAETRGEHAAKRIRLTRRPMIDEYQPSITEYHGTRASTSVQSTEYHPPFRGGTRGTQSRAGGPERGDP